MRVLGSCSALALALLLGGAALAQSPARSRATAPHAAPAQSAPVIPAPAAPAASAGPAINLPEGAAQKLKPPADFLVDCSELPADAVKEVPAEIARWSTLYCTQYGQLFSSNDKYFSAFPGTGLRGAFLAGELSGRAGASGRKAYFKKIAYGPVTPDQVKKLETGLGKEELALVKDKPLFRIDLTTDTGQTSSMVAVDPSQDPFWVIPVVGDKLNRTGFYVASLDYVNRKR